MKSAKEMFEELGFKYEYNKIANQICVYGTKNDDSFLWIYLDRKIFDFNNEIDMNLFKAIQKQIEELGWLNEK